MLRCRLCGREISEEYFDLSDNELKKYSEEKPVDWDFVYCNKCMNELGKKPEISWIKKLFWGGKNE